jgi:membrane protein DedA with SNARE-associated domain
MYAFGIPAQVMAGTHHFPLRRAVIANALGSAGWLVLLYALAHVFTSSSVAEASLREVRLDFTLFVAIGLMIYFLLGKLAKKLISKKDGTISEA